MYLQIHVQVDLSIYMRVCMCACMCLHILRNTNILQVRLDFLIMLHIAFLIPHPSPHHFYCNSPLNRHPYHLEGWSWGGELCSSCAHLAPCPEHGSGMLLIKHQSHGGIVLHTDEDEDGPYGERRLSSYSSLTRTAMFPAETLGAWDRSLSLFMFLFKTQMHFLNQSGITHEI